MQAKQVSQSVSIAFGLCAGIILAGNTQADPRQALEPSAGRSTFIDACAFCHGVYGRGDGQASNMLEVKPTDLTKLEKNNWGEFPWRVVYETIDGRGRIKTHAKVENMPAWGEIWTEAVPPQYSQFAETYVKGRILELMMFLKSIQEE